MCERALNRKKKAQHTYQHVAGRLLAQQDLVKGSDKHPLEPICSYSCSRTRGCVFAVPENRTAACFATDFGLGLLSEGSPEPMAFWSIAL